MWETIIISVLLLYLSYSQAPKPPKPKPPSMEDLTISTAEEGKPIGVLCGTRVMQSSNCLWYGDFKYKAIKSDGGGK